MRSVPVRPLYQLGSLYGVQTSYSNVNHRRQTTTPEALLLLLRALGAPLETVADAPAALRAKRQDLWRRPLEPVVVAWDGRPSPVELRLPAERGSGTLACTFREEGGDVTTWSCDAGQLPVRREASVEGVRYLVKELVLPVLLPLGYHRLRIEGRGIEGEALLISAPLNAYAPPRDERGWGVFLPLYALHREQSWGTGDLGDLDALREWTAGLGGRIVGTLPLLAAYLDEPFDPSPYSPASRLFWNELYVDPTRVPELAGCASARELLTSTPVQQEREKLQAMPLVDYRRAMALKRKALEDLARCFFEEESERREAFQQYLAQHPTLADYAQFRAVGERQHLPWPQWTQALQDRSVNEGDYERQAYRYHLYAQWLAGEQLEAQKKAAEGAKGGLYLDLPLGVHTFSYDVWRHRDLFALDAEGGAPPDRFFTGGQTWGFPPMHPEESRRQGHAYFIECLRHHLGHAGLLRIDHVMGLHRLFWVPRGGSPQDGMYVRYPAEELYAVVSLESHRCRAWVVGENLGIVPAYVNRAMARHGIHRMYVLEAEMRRGPQKALRPTPRDALASINTHDMPTFVTFWDGLDIQARIDTGLLEDHGAQVERQRRWELREALETFLRREGRLDGPATASSVLRACLAHLAASPAQAVLVNLEDLWLEPDSQNIPGDGRHPNWRRKARYSLESLSRIPEVFETLREIDRLRRREGARDGTAKDRRET